MPSFLSHLVQIVPLTQGLFSYDEETFSRSRDIKDQILTLTQYFEGLRKEDSLDLAERIFQAWKANSLRDSLTRLNRVAGEIQLRKAGNALWRLRLGAGGWQQDSETDEKMSASRVHAPLEVPRVANDPYRLSIHKAKKLLAGYSANPLSLSDTEPQTGRSTVTEKSSTLIHERLYQEAALKRQLTSQFERFAITAPLKSCTFRPNIDVIPARDRGNVHER